MKICRSDNTVLVVAQLNDWSSGCNLRAPGSISDQSMWVGFVVDQLVLKFSFEYIGFLFPVSFHQWSGLICILSLLLQEERIWDLQASNALSDIGAALGKN